MFDIQDGTVRMSDGSTEVVWSFDVPEWVEVINYDGKPNYISLEDLARFLDIVNTGN